MKRASTNVQTSAPPSSGLFDGLEREMWFLDRMHQLGAAGVFGLLSGVTDEATRRERIHEVMLSNGLSSVVIGRRHGKCETFAECYERLFGALDSNTVPRRKR